ncbi:MAG TPA: IS1 family transposase [Candidatus Megaira endosymbiont of Nemacystus decipiens]|nr:IS1 family transposase [Candidatus Megaera endosymbiont of Nemacystus decipiens]
MDFQVTKSRNFSTYLLMAMRLGSRYNINYLCTDGYEAYSKYNISKQHTTTKAETSLVESFNSLIRHYLARFNRKTKRYSKSFYSYIDQGARGQDFSKALQVFVSTFKDIDRIKDSILLVVSRVPAGVEAHNVINLLEEIADIHQVSDNTTKMIRHLKNSMYVFHEPTKEGEVVKGPGWELIEKLESCDVKELVQFPYIPNEDYQKAIVEIVKEADQEVADRKKFEDAGINMDNIPNASFFKKVIDFLYDGFSNLTILGKLGEYIGGIFTSLASLAGGNNFKNPTFTDEIETQLTPKKIQLAKCIVKVLSCDDGNLNEEIDKKFTECVKKYANSHDDEFKRNTVKEFADFLKSKIDLRKELANFADESQSDDELYLEDSSDDESFNKETKKVANVQSFQSDQEESDNLSNDKTTNSTVTKLSQEKSKALTNKLEEEDKTTNFTVTKSPQEKNEALTSNAEEEDKTILPVSNAPSNQAKLRSFATNTAAYYLDNKKMHSPTYEAGMFTKTETSPEETTVPITFMDDLFDNNSFV